VSTSTSWDRLIDISSTTAPFVNHKKEQHLLGWRLTHRGTALLLARASSEEQHLFVGNQAGGRVFLFLQTDDFWRDYERMVALGITFVRPPSVAPYGTVAVFEDLYGNRWDLLEYRSAST
jgi:uncharacterized glyoxalase superfamily protein PhnB